MIETKFYNQVPVSSSKIPASYKFVIQTTALIINEMRKLQIAHCTRSTLNTLYDGLDSTVY